MNLGAHRREKPTLGFDVANLGNVVEGDFVFGEDRRSHARQGGVFGSRYVDRPDQRVTTSNYILVHERLGCPLWISVNRSDATLRIEPDGRAIRRTPAST